MIKKFEKFDNKERFVSFVKEAFVDFIDDDIFSIGVGSYEILISIKLPFFYNNFTLTNMSSVININKEQTELMEEAKVAILRIKDEFGIEPSSMCISLEDIETDEADDYYKELLLYIRYSNLLKIK